MATKANTSIAPSVAKAVGGSTSRMGGVVTPVKKFGTYQTIGAMNTGSSLTQAQIKRIKAAARKTGSKTKREISNANLTTFGRKTGFLSIGCQETLGKVYGYARNRANTTRAQGTFLCKVPPFKERPFSTQENELRVFVEGAEVSSYMRGSASWSIQTTGGMNSLRFQLNNDADSFIVTPVNVCSNLSLSGWRVSKNEQGALDDSTGRDGARFDEVPKYQIYKRKYNTVNPGSENNANIDDTGMWLYPLNPYSCIFNVHDAVRMSARLPYTSGVGKKISGKARGWELWMPAFTGVIKSVSWHDDPVGGDRYVNVDCYDYKGLMDRMRVRTTGFRQPPSLLSGGAKKKVDVKAYSRKNAPDGSKGSAKDIAIKWDKKFEELGLLEKLEELHRVVNKSELLRCTKAGTTQADCIKKAADAAFDARKAFIVPFQILFDIDRVNSSLLKTSSGEVWNVGRKQKTPTATGAPTPTATSSEELLWQKASKGNTVSFIDCVKSFATAIVVSEIKTKLTGSGAKVIFSGPLWVRPPVDRNSTYSVEALEAFERAKMYDSLRKFAFGGGYPNAGITGDGKQVGEISLLAMFRADHVVGSSIMATMNDQIVGGRVTTDFKDINSFVDLTKLDWGKLRDKRLLMKRAAELTVTKMERDSKTAHKEGVANGKKIDDLRKKLNQRLVSAYAELKQAMSAAGDEIVRKVTRDITARAKVLHAEGNKRLRPGIKGDPIRMIYAKEVTFNASTAGLFGDLVIQVTKGTPHPLANKSFEQSVEWLLCQQTEVKPGFKTEVKTYAPGVLEEWNRNAIFGALGRAYTYQEITAIGKLTTSDYLKDIFSPLNCYYNLLVPKSGTGARTMMQTDMSATPLNAQTIQYETRLSLMNMICDLLDFQWYISPMGDSCVEMPNYNVLPDTYGPMFGGSYKVQLDWQGGDINEESSLMSTAWIFTGNEGNKQTQGAVPSDGVIQHQYQKEAVIAPVLAKRIGVKVEDVRINLPQVGAQIAPKDQRGGLSAIRIWGLVYIQRQLGAVHTISCSLPFRPYLLPNRPLWIVPRQRIGLIASVDHSAAVPNGAVTTSVTTKYVRWLHRDGTFRTMAGGYRQPVDFTGFFTGVQSFDVRLGVGSSNRSTLTGLQGAADYALKANRGDFTIDCSPGVQGRNYEASSSYNDDAGSIVKKAPTYSGSTSGAAGVSGTDASRDGFDEYEIGRKVYRIKSDKSINVPNAVATTEYTGLQETGGKKKNSKTKSGARYDTTRLFHNPWPFSTGNSGGDRLPSGEKIRFTNWAAQYLDSTNFTGAVSGSAPVGKARYVWHKSTSLPHAGIDIMAPRGSDIICPINANSVQAAISTAAIFGKGGYNNPKKWVAIKSKGDIPPELIVKKKDGSLSYSGSEGHFSSYIGSGLFGVKKPAPGATWVPSSLKALVYITQYQYWLKSGKNTPVKRSTRGLGIYIACHGKILPPKYNSDPIYSRAIRLGTTRGLDGSVTIAHCQELETSKISKSGWGKGVQKGTVIGKVGTTGAAAAPHVHVELFLKNPEKHNKARKVGRKSITRNIPKEEQDLFNDAVKANKEYLESLLILKVTGGKPDSGTIHPKWLAYFKSRGVVVKTVREAVDVLLKSSKTYSILTNHNTGTLLTNALFYFKPEEIVPGTYVYKKYANVFVSTSSINGAAADDQAKSICGKLPSIEARRLQVALKSCLVKAGRNNKYNKANRDRCNTKYNNNLIALNKTRQIDAQKVNQKLDNKVQRNINKSGTSNTAKVT